MASMGTTLSLSRKVAKRQPKSKLKSILLSKRRGVMKMICLSRRNEPHAK